VNSSSTVKVSANERRIARSRLWQASGVAAVTLALVLYGHASLRAQPSLAKPLQLAVPAYVFPGQAPLVTLQRLNPSPGIVILNPDNGDGPFNAQWQSQANRLRKHGITVLGYVYTSQASRPIADVEASINNYLNSASGAPHVSGIFLDEMSTSCSTEPYYAQLYDYIKSVDPGSFVMANPGTAVNVCFLRPNKVAANTFVTFEHDAATYASQYKGNIVNSNGSVTSGTRYPVSSFCHLIYGVSSSQMHQIIGSAASRHVGYAYVTDDNLPNPWDSVASYIYAEAKVMAHKSVG
jgi:Spherulation-specific family 4